MKNKFLILLLIISSQIVLGFELRVEYSPENPRAGESFQVYFIATTDQGEELNDIEFDPIGAEVLSKDGKSTSTRTTYINGKLSSYTSQTISYDLFADQGSKQVTLSNIKLKSNKGVERYDDIKVQLLGAKTTKDFFVKAAISNNDLYVGQGVTLNYYLYSRTSTSNLEIKKFPVLKNTLKRFNKQRFTTSRVNYNGQTYDRTQIYSTVIFPEKSGVIEIDPITISARFSMGRSRGNDSFSVFGFDFGSTARRIRKVLKSETVKLKIKPLPRPVPQDYSGLVGKHEFSIEFNKTRFLSNEPVEIKLTVEGTGELEAFAAPEILDESKFEKFDSDGKLSLGNLVKVRKDFSYTYLAKTAGQYPARSIKISTFDPQVKRYINHVMKVPAIIVAGGVIGADRGRSSGAVSLSGAGGSVSLNESNGIANSSFLNTNDQKQSSFNQVTGLVGPYFQYQSTVNNWLNILIAVLSLMLIAVMILIFKRVDINRNKTPYDKMLKKLQSNKWKYYDLYQFLDLLRFDKKEMSMLAIVKESELSSDAKSFFKKVIEVSSQKEYSKESIKGVPRLKSVYLKEVAEIAQKYKSHNHKVDEFEYL